MVDKIYDAWELGKAHVILADEKIEASFKLGRILSGRKRLHCGFFVSIDVSNMQTFVAENEFSLRQCLFDLESDMKAYGLILNALGLSSSFMETDHSRNTGMGYVSGEDHIIHMLDDRAWRSRNRVK
jgi:hypothetical protein